MCLNYYKLYEVQEIHLQRPIQIFQFSNIFEYIHWMFELETRCASDEPFRSYLVSHFSKNFTFSFRKNSLRKENYVLYYSHS